MDDFVVVPNADDADDADDTNDDADDEFKLFVF